MKRRAIAAVSVVLLVACGPPAKKPVITLGGVLSVTGPAAVVGQEQLQAAQLAIDEINKAGGILGSELAINNQDDGLDTARARASAQTLLDLKVPAIIGAIASAGTLAVNEVVSPSNVVQVSGASTSALLSTANDRGTLFRTCASDALQGKLLAKRAKAKNFTRVASIFVPGPYGRGLTDTFATAFAPGTMTATREYTEGQSGYAQLLSDVIATGPQAILLVAYPVDGAKIVRDYVQFHSGRDLFWFFPDALEDTAFVTAAGASFTFQHEGTGPSSPAGPASDAFIAAFRGRIGREPSRGTYSANVYDAVYLIALAMLSAGSADGALVKDELIEVSSQGRSTTAADFTRAAADLAKGGDVDFIGASGSLDMDANGDVTGAYDLWRVQGSGISILEQGLSP